jgi:hypothetical protein
MHGRSGALENLKLRVNTGFIPHPPTSHSNSHGAHWHVLLEYAMLYTRSLGWKDLWR